MHDTVLPAGRSTIDLAAPPDDVNSVHDHLESVWDRHPEVGELDRISFETALIELVSNVIRHGNGGFGIRCSVTVTVTLDRIQAQLVDDGEPGDIQLTGRGLPDDLAESGRGNPLITALVDVVRYERSAGRNAWHLARTLTR